VKRMTYAIALLAVLALVVAGCGGGGSSSSSATESGGGGETASSEGSGYSGKGGGAYASPTKEEESASPEETGAAVVSLGNSKELGMILVDSEGMTVYDFHKDKGTTSSCYGPCAEGWPPVLTEGNPQVGNGASSSMLGTTERKDGTMQVTYAGHPLYTFVEDKKPGEANGNDVSAFGGQWYALKGNGEEAGD
jgi:predicted lipoprotein with Yx(FWY)xxD motif